MVNYLTDTSRLLTSYESALNFGDLLGGINTVDIANEGSVGDRLKTISNHIKSFFVMLWNAITRFIKDHITGETMIWKGGEDAIKRVIQDFMTVFNDGLTKVLKAGNQGNATLESQISEFKENLKECISRNTEFINNKLETFGEKKKDIKSNPNMKANAVPVKNLKSVIEREYNILKGSSNRVYEILTVKNEEDITNDEVVLCSRAVNTALEAVNSLYSLLFKALRGFKVHFNPNLKTDD